MQQSIQRLRFADPPTVEDIIALTKQLTGRKPTTEEMAEVKWILAGLERR